MNRVPVTIATEEDREYLKQISLEVDIQNDKELASDIEKLTDYCKSNDVLALASIQIRIPKRLVYLKNTDLEIVKRIQSDSEFEEDKTYDEEKIMINPVITKREGLTEYYEACASCLDFMGRVLRPYRIYIDYYDVNGNKHSEVLEGFPATVVSHEIDHLDGILHIDIAEEVLEMPREERKKWRQTHEYRVFSKYGDYEFLKAQQKGKVK